MNTIINTLGIERLSVPERIELISAIWDTIPSAVDDSVPQWHKEELDRRMANPSPSIPWEEVKARLLEKP